MALPKPTLQALSLIHISTFLIGGIVRAYGTNAHSGRGRSYVVEADESDKSFTYLSPAAAIVTNLSLIHI